MLTLLLTAVALEFEGDRNIIAITLGMIPAVIYFGIYMPLTAKHCFRHAENGDTNGKPAICLEILKYTFAALFLTAGAAVLAHAALFVRYYETMLFITVLYISVITVSLKQTS